MRVFCFKKDRGKLIAKKQQCLFLKHMYSRREEFWNTLSHAIGALLGVAGLIVLLLVNNHKSSYSTMSIIIYGISLIVLFSASTLYHAVRTAKWKRIMRKVDHISIYLLIAGTYTPVALISLIGHSGWTIFWTVWGIALAGGLLKIFFTGRFEWFSLLLYLVMGWLIVFDLSTLIEVQSTLGLVLLGIGGACYTVGILFYAVQKIPFNHFIWHLFVLAWAVFHFFFILLDVV
jgi:hemolysin III